MNDVFRTIIIPAAPVLKARVLGASLSPAGAGMYLTALSPTGALPATHYISSGFIGADFASLIPLTSFTTVTGPDMTSTITATTTPGQPAILLGAAKKRALEQGITLSATLAQVTTILDTSDVSEQQPFEAMARLGLQMMRGVL